MPMVVPLSRHYGCRRRVERSPDPGASEELENVRNAMVKELLTIDEDAPVSLAPAIVPSADNVALMFERLAKDPAVDVEKFERLMACLLYTSDAADERSSVDLGGRRI